MVPVYDLLSSFISVVLFIVHISHVTMSRYASISHFATRGILDGCVHPGSFSLQHTWPSINRTWLVHSCFLHMPTYLLSIPRFWADPNGLALCIHWRFVDGCWVYPGGEVGS